MVKAILKLRGVDPQKVLDKYQSGDYTDVALPSSSKRVAPIKGGESNEDAIYTLVNKSNGKITFVTTNCTIIPTGVSKRCRYCGRDFDHSPVGLPVLKQKDVVHYMGSFCSFECVLALIRLKDSAGIYHNSCLYSNSEVLLKFIFHRLYPEEKLSPAPDPDLLDVHGGPLAYRQWNAHEHRFQEMPGLLFQPCRMKYTPLKPS